MITFSDYKNPEEYWDSLGEYEGGLIKARELWHGVKPLYLKLQKYIALRLKGTDFVGKPLPVHLLSKCLRIYLQKLIDYQMPYCKKIFAKNQIFRCN